MGDFAPGDLVVCVDANCGNHDNDPPYHSPLVVGRMYTVASVHRGPWADGCPAGLHVAEIANSNPVGFCIGRFRKIDKADEGFSAWMQTMRPKEETREPSNAPAIADGRRMAETPLGGSGRSPTSGGARQRNRPTLPALDPIEIHPITPTFTLYTNPDLVKAIWEGSVE